MYLEISEVDANSIPISATNITLFASPPKLYALPLLKLMLMPPHRLGDPPGAMRQLFSVMKIWQENFAANLSLCDRLSAHY